MSQPTVLVLAGGASNRFWPLRDKLFFEFGSRSLLERHLRALKDLGCERFVIVTRPDAVDAVTQIARAAGVDATVAVQKEAKGMADAVLSARDVLGDAPLYLTQAHDVTESLHADVLGAWQKRASDGLIAAVRVDTYFPGGYLTTNGDRVTSIVEKPGAGKEPSDLVNLVAHVFASPKALVDAVDQEPKASSGDDVYERAVSRMMATGEFRGYVYSGAWRALKYPWHLLDVMHLLLDLWSRGVESPGDDYECRNGVFYGRDVKLLPGAHVAAPALIGHGAMIGNNALVRGSIIGPGSVVGFGSEIARSYVGANVELHHNYVGDSVLDANTSMGWGATTANYRIDGRTVPSVINGERVDTEREKLGMILGAGSKIGVNTSIMPGVKIGANTLIGPAIRVTRDVPDNARVLDEEEYGRF